jgi:predicted PurR-regulated permease PerM
MDRERIFQLFFFGFLALIAYELLGLVRPFVVPVLWAILLAFIFYPLLHYIDRYTKSRALSALILTIAVAALIIIPSLWLSSLLAVEAQTIYARVSEMVNSGELARMQDQFIHSRFVHDLNAALGRRGIRIEEQLPKLAMEAAKLTSDLIMANATGVAKNVAGFVIDFGIVLLTFFYLLCDGEHYYEGIRNLTPLHDEDKRAVFDSLRNTLSSVIRGMLITALAQGLLIGLGLAVLGVPYWAFLSILSAGCGLLPFAGTALVWVPACGYLLYVDGWGRAIALLLWGSLAVGTIDNFIKPYVMGHGIGLPTLVLFFAIAGGLEAYGPLGIFLGPAIMAVFAALLRVYSRTYGAAQREAA